MSSVRSDVDLAALARPEAALKPPRRSKLRILVPTVLLLGFGALLASTLTDLFGTVHDATVVRPTRPNADQVRALGEGTIVVQASGWIEPDPFPTEVVALAEGVVEELHVQESDTVEADQVVATLIDDDARIVRDSAEAELAIRKAELAEAQARSTIAEERLEASLEVTEAVEVARAAHDGAVAAAARRAAAVVEGEARVRLAADELVVQEELRDAGASGPRQVELAEGALREAEGRLEGLRAEAALAAAEVEAAAARLTRAERDLELRFDDRLAVELARALVAHGEAEVRGAEATLEEAELRLARMEVRAPSGGVVLERLTVLGAVLAGADRGRAVCTLYDPSSLRVRIDVPQPDVEHLFVGQRVEVESESRRGRPYAGEVLRIVQRANLSKVTLEAQVRVLDGDALLRPEMLAQVRFFGRPIEPDSGGDADSTAVVLIPERLLEGEHVWVVGAGEVAERRQVAIGAAHGDLVEVHRGVNLTDKLIDEVFEGGRAALEEGDRLRIGGIQ